LFAFILLIYTCFKRFEIFCVFTVSKQKKSMFCNEQMLLTYKYTSANQNYSQTKLKRDKRVIIFIELLSVFHKGRSILVQY